MRIARLGKIHHEKPAIICDESEAVFVDDIISDWNRTELENGAMEKIRALDISKRPRVKIADYRLGV
jgi:hypothetical protein